MTPLHWIGEHLRNAARAVPLPAVRFVFLALLVAVLTWIFLRRPDPEDDPKRFQALKLWAAAALAIQILVYALL
jgi:hypothetical protein